MEMNSFGSLLKSPPSLEYLSLVNYCSHLLKTTVIKKILKPLFIESVTDVQEYEWPSVRYNLRIWIWRNLVLPTVFKEKLIIMLKIMAVEINIFLRNHFDFLGYVQFTSESVNNISFTSLGIVDKIKTVKLFVKDEKFWILKRLQLACVYCLEEEIISLWRHFRYGLDNYPTILRYELPVKFWESIVNGNCDSSGTLKYETLANIELNRANEIATEYYGKKLNDQSFFFKAAKYAACFRCLEKQMPFPSEHSKVLMHFLSVLPNEQIFEVLKNHCYEILLCLLDWPWQYLFLKALNLAWPYLSKDKYISLVNVILKDRIKIGAIDYDYINLFTCFWETSPKSFKEVIIGSSSKSVNISVMCSIFATGNDKIVDLILNYATLDQRITIVCDDKIIEYLSINNEFNLLKFVFEKYLIYTPAFDRCRSRISQKISNLRRGNSNKLDMWQKFLKFLDELSHVDKRTKKKKCK